jgi:hypothetical protein
VSDGNSNNANDRGTVSIARGKLGRYSGDDRATAFDNFEQEAYQIALDAGWIEPNHPLITLTRVRK